MGKSPVDWVSFVLAVLIHVQLFLIALWDTWIWVSGSEARTVSAIVWRWAQQFPVGLLFLGFVLGHVFWPLRMNKGE